jgi:hypothetical protein
MIVFSIEMRTTYLLRYVALAATMFGFATAQDSVPKDLTAAFADSGVELQVSFTNNAVDGFKDGISFGKDGKSFVRSINLLFYERSC